MRVLAAFLMVAMSTTAFCSSVAAKTNPNLKYFSVWEAEDPTPQGGSNNPKLQADWVNFLFTGADPAVLRSYHNATGISSLLAVRTAFFCGNKLCPDYKQKWATLLESTVKPMLADGSIFGVFFGDEICWSCTTWADVNTAVSTVRSDLPRGKAILYYNEAYPVIAGGVVNGTKYAHICDTGGDFDDHRVNISYPNVPDGLDWISVDYYPDEGTAPGARKLFENSLYPLMSSNQMALFVPPAYGCNTTACSNQLCCSASTPDGPNPPCDGNCSKAMVQWAAFCYDWARTDPRLIGLNPWHWSGTPGAGQFQPGLAEMPAVLAAYQKIGREIVSGRQADIDFGI